MQQPEPLINYLWLYLKRRFLKIIFIIKVTSWDYCRTIHVIILCIVYLSIYLIYLSHTKLNTLALGCPLHAQRLESRLRAPSSVYGNEMKYRVPVRRWTDTSRSTCARLAVGAHAGMSPRRVRWNVTLKRRR